MRTASVASLAVFLVGMLFFGCAATMKSPAPVSDPAKPFELEKLSFLAPPGEGWHFIRESAPPVEYVLFMKKGAVQSQGFLAAVSQFRTDTPVTSENDLSDKMLQPYLEEIEARSRYEILKSECDHDESFSRVGVLCYAEVRDSQVAGMEPSEAITIRGYGYAFVHPDDNRIVGVVELYERGLSDRLSADTKTMLGQFAQSVTLR